MVFLWLSFRPIGELVDIIKVFLEFHSFMKLEKSLNATFIALIPRREEALEVKDYHPISLMNGCTRLYLRFLAII